MQCRKAIGGSAQSLRDLTHQRFGPLHRFSFWVPHGKRTPKALEIMAFIQTGPGELAHRSLPGPSSWEAWRASWRIFRNAMMMLKASMVGALDADENFIRKLALKHPHNWGVVCRADGIMRSEGWVDLKEQLEINLAEGFHRGPYNPGMAWETVINTATQDKDFWVEHITDVLDVVNTSGFTHPGQHTS